MPHVGPLEIAIVLVIGLLLVGPRRLPGLGRSVGEGLRELRTSFAGDGDERPKSDTQAGA